MIVAEAETVEYLTIPDGRAGVIATLRYMRQLVREGRKSPRVRQTAHSFIQNIPGKDWMGEIYAAFNFVRQNIRYTLDVNEIETLYTPDKILENRVGDCDDMSVLLASLLECLGHPTAFKAVGFVPGELSHVYVLTRVGENWIALDPTEPNEIGWEPPNIKDKAVVHV